VCDWLLILERRVENEILECSSSYRVTQKQAFQEGRFTSFSKKKDLYTNSIIQVQPP
jgi:hypothetical protein